MMENHKTTMTKNHPWVFKRQTNATLKTRRIVKAKRTGQASSTKQTEEEDDDAPKPNPFANLASSSSVFGSGFKSASFGANTSGGFGFGSGGGGGFSVGSGFQSQAATVVQPVSLEVPFRRHPRKVPVLPLVLLLLKSEPHAFPDEMKELKTGEEDEVCVLEVRAKTHQFVEKKQVAVTSYETTRQCTLCASLIVQ